jgi:hypothetical protein
MHDRLSNIENKVIEILEITIKRQEKLVEEMLLRFREISKLIDPIERKNTIKENVLMGITDGIKDQITEMTKNIENDTNQI